MPRHPIRHCGAEVSFVFIERPQPEQINVFDRLASFSMLAAGETGAFRAIEYSLPEEPWEWVVYVGGFAVLALLGLRVALKDSIRLHGFWRVWLILLRVAVLAGIIVIALNPQERTRKLAFRPSHVAVLVDRSLSMQLPEKARTTDTSAEAQRSRSAAVLELLADSDLIDTLRRNHTVSIYSFDSGLHGPHAVLRSNDPRVRRGDPGESPPANGEVTAGDTAAGDSTASSDTVVDWNPVIEPVGVETRLGESLIELIRTVSGKSLSGVVVIGDGASNSGVDPESAIEQARIAKARILTVGVGSTQQQANLLIANLQAPSDVHVGDGFEISAFIQAQGLAGSEIVVELLGQPAGTDGEPEILGTRDAVMGEDGIPVEVSFEQLQNQAGEWEYFARTKARQRVLELSETDNERRKSINVVDRKTKVLLFAGGPMRDYRFVRNMLYRHSAIQTDVWLQSSDAAGAVSQEANQLLTSFPATKEELFEYDVLVAFDPDWRELSPDQQELLKEWVFAQAGGLILIAGDVFTPMTAELDQLEGVRELYPVVLNSFVVNFGGDQNATQAWPFEFTREGRESGFLQITDDPLTSAAVWQEFTGIYACYPTNGTKAGTTIYARYSDPRSQTSDGLPILLAAQYYGAGRVMYLGSPEMWRLRAIDEEHFDRFWTKTIRESGQARLKRGNNRGTLLLERSQYLLGQTVRVRAQILDAQFEPLTANSVVADVFDSNGRPMSPPLTLQQDASRAGQFVGSFRVSTPGVWRLELPIPQSAERLVEKVDVVLPNLETDNARQNAQLLRLIGEVTGGAYFPIAEAAAGIPSRLPDMGEEFQIDQQLRTLWDREWLMYLLIALLSVEWLTRKLLKLA
jgi:hypothetical protein